MRTGPDAKAAVVALGAVLVALGVLAAMLRSSPVPSPSPAPIVDSTRSPGPAGQACGSSLQAVIDAAAADATLDLGGCTYAAGATIWKPLTVVGATVRVPPGKAGITVAADDVTLDGMDLIGTQSATFVFDEVGISAMGTPAAPIRRLAIRNSRIVGFGGFGAYLASVIDVRVQDNDVDDIVYAGVMVLSGTRGVIEGNTVRRIGVEGSEANGNNAYGIALTTRPASASPTSDFVVEDNTVEDVPTWHAFDTHGGRRIVFAGNTVLRSMRGVFITTDAAENRPTDIVVMDNKLLSPAPIQANIAAVTTYNADTVAIVRNTATGWGNGNFYGDFGGLSTRVVLDANVVEP